MPKKEGGMQIWGQEKSLVSQKYIEGPSRCHEIQQKLRVGLVQQTFPAFLYYYVKIIEADVRCKSEYSIIISTGRLSGLF